MLYPDNRSHSILHIPGLLHSSVVFSAIPWSLVMVTLIQMSPLALSSRSLILRLWAVTHLSNDCYPLQKLLCPRPRAPKSTSITYYLEDNWTAWPLSESGFILLVFWDRISCSQAGLKLHCSKERLWTPNPPSSTSQVTRTVSMHPSLLVCAWCFELHYIIRWLSLDHWKISFFYFSLLSLWKFQAMHPNIIGKFQLHFNQMGPSLLSKEWLYHMQLSFPKSIYSLGRTRRRASWTLSLLSPRDPRILVWWLSLKPFVSPVATADLCAGCRKEGF